MKRLLLAAEQGDPDAQFNVGVMYDNGTDDDGNGIRRKRGEAIMWLHRAARQGLPRALGKLAEVYANDGAASPRDSIRACAWYLLAMTRLDGAYHQKAKAGFERVTLNMTPDAVDAARRFANSWEPRHKDPASSPHSFLSAELKAAALR